MKNLLYIFILLYASTLYSQKKGLIYYGFIDAIGTGNAKGPDSNAYMVFNKEKSYYVTAKDSLEKTENIDKQTTYSNDDEKSASIHLGMKVSRIGDQVFYNTKKNTIWSNFLRGNQVFVNEIATKIDWKISNETKKIGNFTCKKATALFRGRNYTAWFTSEIPVPFGPWKLNGLPGLILEAYDSEKNVFWYFKSVEYPSNTREPISNIRNIKGNKATYLSIPEFEKYCREEIQQSYEKMIIISKQHPGIVPVKGKLKDHFIEIIGKNE
ncbi:GLPGLI family protein [Flavobacterium arsenatis]|uniref:GLPGLI family protein n=1 Tax=Flavobacterium arsenatis TaxID=1484332 RepID=A0ABU1TKW6_9FLAO|nr:GLPGLI family protein [Flavobacterium arsenatis]MDR6966591.1 GLPGLI family protein [Flavobacterium arsenatis]